MATDQMVTTERSDSGGAATFQLGAPPSSLDPYTQTSFLASHLNGLSYSKLWRFKAGVPDVAPTDPSMEPDLAQSMGEQADPQTLVVKLKPAKWHNVPPMNGRALTSEDIRYAVDRYRNLDTSVHKNNYIWLDKLETPDPQTAVFKTKYPYADLVQIMGGNVGAYLAPKEHAEGLDAATKMVGSGPYLHTEDQGGVSVTFKKNRDYYDTPFPYLDELKALVVADSAQRVADFSARSVDLTWQFLADERDQLKENRPDAMFEETQAPGSYIFLRTDRPPFSDRRVRQALSMGVNRMAIRDTLSKGEGQPDQIVFVGLEGWARPVKDLGPAAKYWDYNPQEARALLAAAGVPNLTFDWHHADAAVYGQHYVELATLVQAQWQEIGVSATDKQQAYAQYIGTTYQRQYEGIGHSPRAVPYYLDHLTDKLYWDAAKGPAGRARINLSYVNNPQLNQLLDKQRGQFTQAERMVTIMAIETLCAEEQYEIFMSTNTRTFFWDPKVTNYRPHAWSSYTHLMRIRKD